MSQVIFIQHTDYRLSPQPSQPPSVASEVRNQRGEERRGKGGREGGKANRSLKTRHGDARWDLRSGRTWIRSGLDPEVYGAIELTVCAWYWLIQHSVQMCLLCSQATIFKWNYDYTHIALPKHHKQMRRLSAHFTNEKTQAQIND